MRTPLAATAALLIALALPAAAGAHVTVQPAAAPEGGFARLDVRVPNERDDQGTVKVDMKLPPGVIAAAYEPVPGWSTKVTRERLKTPIEVDGLAVSDQVARVTWTADRHHDAIRPGQFRDFGLSLAVPQGKPGDTLPFKALQTYEGGEIVRWIGPSDSDEPAPTLTLTASGAGGGHGAPTEAGERASAPAAAATADAGGDDTLAIVALAVGALGLVAGLAGLFAARRRGAS